MSPTSVPRRDRGSREYAAHTHGHDFGSRPPASSQQRHCFCYSTARGSSPGPDGLGAQRTVFRPAKTVILLDVERSAGMGPGTCPRTGAAVARPGTSYAARGSPVHVVCFVVSERRVAASGRVGVICSRSSPRYGDSNVTYGARAPCAARGRSRFNAPRRRLTR